MPAFKKGVEQGVPIRKYLLVEQNLWFEKPS
jgi:hypothetical protein